MKMIALSLVGSVLLVAPASAQTIIGESTYEDNYLHTRPSPPAEAPASPVAGRPKADIAPAQDHPALPDQRR